MTRPKYVPSKRDLSKAWTVKKNGGTNLDVCKRLGITHGQYIGNLQLFNSYFRREKLALKRTIDTKRPAKNVYKRKPPSYKNGEKKLSLDDIDLDVLRSYVICGFNRETISGLLGVSRSTLFCFIRDNPDVNHVFNYGEKEVVSDVINKGLLRLCKKRKVPKIHFASYLGEITKEHYKEVLEPNLGAIKYLIANKLGWQSEPRPEASNNKGAILKMLDAINNGEEHQNEETTTDKQEEKE